MSDKNKEWDPKSYPDKRSPAAGPHDKPALTDEEKTPGSGAFPKPGESDSDDMAPTG